MNHFRLYFTVFIFLFSAVRAFGSEPPVLPADSVPKPLPQISSVDSILNAIDRIHEKSKLIEKLSTEGFNLEEITAQLPEIKANIGVLKTTLNGNVKVMEMKNLQTFALLISTSRNQLTAWRKQLIGYHQQLINLDREITKLHSDSTLGNYQSDSMFNQLYTTELQAIDTSWNKTRVYNAQNLQKIARLHGEISVLFYELDDLQQELSQQIGSYSSRVFKQEYPLIWQPSQKQLDQQSVNIIRNSVAVQQDLISDYVKANFTYHFFLAMLIGTGFIIWVRRNYLVLKRTNRLDDWEKFTKSGLLSSFPLLPAFILILNAVPFFDFNPPGAYVNLIQFSLFITVSIFIYRNWSRKDRIRWTKIGITYLVFLVLNTVVNPGMYVRLGLLAANIYFTINAYNLVNDKQFSLRLSKFATFAIYVFLTMNALAVLLNIAGRVTLAKALGNAAIAGYVQMVTLTLFATIIKSSVLLNANASAARKNIDSSAVTGKLNHTLSRLLSVLIVILWLIVFTSNLSVYNYIVDSVNQFLFTPRTVGSTSFTIGNIVLFFVVIWLSTLAQKNVGLLFGEKHGTPLDGQKKGSRVMIFKLLIILTGGFIALIVSGLPVDKITVVIGALGVGIGLGLQNIVNNFVSGMILIFERPLEVGDYVEISGFKGWVRDIGIRATRLSDEDGADILVPNGAILSGNLVNWTLTNSTKRLEISLEMPSEVVLQEANELITETISKEKTVMKNRAPEIFIQATSETSVELKVLFWVGNVSRQSVTRSNIIRNLQLAFPAQPVKIR